MYLVKAKWWMKLLSPSGLIWKMPLAGKPAVYLTFDDGPHPDVTPLVLDMLAAHEAKATFFCVGNNIDLYPDVFARITAAGHAVGNHTYHHKNGWKTDTDTYVAEIRQTEERVNSRIFRPPYGRITRAQAYMLHEANPPWTIYMWDVLSADFDTHLTPQQCAEQVLMHTRPGSIVVFHDSAKAWERLSFALPIFLQHCREQAWELRVLPTHTTG
jgi:peptidoglycan/xylan/chitin deacetylase (PgdA/CDA1 family)